MDTVNTPNVETWRVMSLDCVRFFEVVFQVSRYVLKGY